MRAIVDVKRQRGIRNSPEQQSAVDRSTVSKLTHLFIKVVSAFAGLYWSIEDRKIGNVSELLSNNKPLLFANSLLIATGYWIKNNLPGRIRAYEDLSVGSYVRQEYVYNTDEAIARYRESTTPDDRDILVVGTVGNHEIAWGGLKLIIRETFAETLTGQLFDVTGLITRFREKIRSLEPTSTTDQTLTHFFNGEGSEIQAQQLNICKAKLSDPPVLSARKVKSLHILLHGRGETHRGLLIENGIAEDLEQRWVESLSGNGYHVDISRFIKELDPIQESKGKFIGSILAISSAERARKILKKVFHKQDIRAVTCFTKIINKNGLSILDRVYTQFSDLLGDRWDIFIVPAPLDSINLTATTIRPYFEHIEQGPTVIIVALPKNRLAR